MSRGRLGAVWVGVQRGQAALLKRSRTREGKGADETRRRYDDACGLEPEGWDEDAQVAKGVHDRVIASQPPALRSQVDRHRRE